MKYVINKTAIATLEGSHWGQTEDRTWTFHGGTLDGEVSGRFTPILSTVWVSYGDQTEGLYFKRFDYADKKKARRAFREYTKKMWALTKKKSESQK